MRRIFPATVFAILVVSCGSDGSSIEDDNDSLAQAEAVERAQDLLASYDVSALPPPVIGGAIAGSLTLTGDVEHTLDVKTEVLSPSCTKTTYDAGAFHIACTGGGVKCTDYYNGAGVLQAQVCVTAGGTRPGIVISRS